ncbi:hypothetical protein X975_06088, partial [Stegodyphus mimosarum]
MDADSRCMRVWREPRKRYHPSLTREKDNYGGGGVIVWVGITLDSRTLLHVLDKDSLTAMSFWDVRQNRCEQIHLKESKASTTNGKADIGEFSLIREKRSMDRNNGRRQNRNSNNRNSTNSNGRDGGGGRSGNGNRNGSENGNGGGSNQNRGSRNSSRRRNGNRRTTSDSFSTTQSDNEE